MHIAYCLYIYKGDIYVVVCPQTNRILLACLSVRLNCQFNIIFYKLRVELFAVVKVQFLCSLESPPPHTSLVKYASFFSRQPTTLRLVGGKRLKFKTGIGFNFLVSILMKSNWNVHCWVSVGKWAAYTAISCTVVYTICNINHRILCGLSRLPRRLPGLPSNISQNFHMFCCSKKKLLKFVS